MKKSWWGLAIILLLIVADKPLIVSAAKNVIISSDVSSYVDEWGTLKSGTDTGLAPNMVTNDWMCIPFQRIGPITQCTTDVDLIQLFGGNNIERRTVRVSEGTETRDVSVIYPDTSNEMTIFWRDNRYGSGPSYVLIQQPGTSWETLYGITVGTSIEELNRINGQPFTISAFYWGVLSKGEGTLVATRQGLDIQLRTIGLQELHGEGLKVASDDPRLLPDKVWVGEFRVTLTSI